MSFTPIYDAAIVGGGPAGAATGAQLAKAGMRVIILEKETFPRFSIGESLLPHGNDLLREIGVWDKLEKAGFLRKYGDSCDEPGILRLETGAIFPVSQNMVEEDGGSVLMRASPAAG